MRKVLEDKEKEHKEELRQATTAVDEDGRPYIWTSGSKKDQDVTWEELAKFREKEKKKAEIQAKADKEALLPRLRQTKKLLLQESKLTQRQNLMTRWPRKTSYIATSNR